MAPNISSINANTITLERMTVHITKMLESSAYVSQGVLYATSCGQQIERRRLVCGGGFVENEELS